MDCLVIEDDADTASLICDALREAGHAVVVSFNALDALRLVRDEIWDVVILDRLLPGNIDGLYIVHTMRRLGDTTPVIILSALDSLEERLRGLRGGADDYLTKPFATVELLARTEALLRRFGTRRSRECGVLS
jgi:two-component system OmpR family response regulator